jgi:hypothetical protein
LAHDCAGVDLMAEGKRIDRPNRTRALARTPPYRPDNMPGQGESADGGATLTGFGLAGMTSETSNRSPYQPIASRAALRSEV